jgi:hypothetical protein
MKTKCNRCGGIPEFAGTWWKNGSVYHRYQCLCGNAEERLVNPIGYDIEDPRALKTVRYNREWAERMGYGS